MLARRDILRHAAAAPIATGGLAAVLADPGLARAAAQSLETVTIETPAGKQVSAAFGAPALAPAPTILLVHEWWGLNDQIKAVAADLNGLGYATLAVDLYDGQVADNPNDAKTYMNGVVPDIANQTLGAWIDWLRARLRHDRQGRHRRLVFRRRLVAQRLPRPAGRGDGDLLRQCRQNGRRTRTAGGPGASATSRPRTSGSTRPWSQASRRAMETAGKPLNAYWYDANHAFANPTGGNYDEADAALAWQRTMEFFAANLV